jgi:transposase
MADSLLVDDAFWAVLEPLLPERPPQRTGRPRVSDRAAFTAIVFVLLTGVPWRMVPKEIGCSGVSAWRRLRDWQAAGVWERLHREMLNFRSPRARPRPVRTPTKLAGIAACLVMTSTVRSCRAS